MSTRPLLMLSVGLAGSLALAACSSPVFPLRPGDAGEADAGTILPGEDVPSLPDDDTPVTPGDDVPVLLTDSGPPVDLGPPVPGTVPAFIARALPDFDSATLARVRAIRADGLSRGNRANVFAKIGDSITEAGGFLQDIGDGYFNLARFAWLQPTIGYFNSVRFSDNRNSFSRYSGSAMGGWISSQPLDGDPNSPLRNELNATRPLYGIVMIGTNDLDRTTLETYTANLTRIVTIMEEFGTVPIVSTIPDRNDQAAPAARVPSFNEAIRALARSRNLPLIDYWVPMHDLPARGISDDGIHPSIWRNGGDPQATDFRDVALQYGYNLRNVTALLMFDRLRSLPQ
ncbi:MAG: SGNH/GDSL hydrolase family protein [Deltaproteobacteria bacterium]|nr:SGNH/GDSL hydrolase family protein [Deltaproteobacteria bacterium]